MNIGIFIPAYNAEQTLASVIARIPKSLEDNIARVYIINDGSTDSTVTIARSLEEANPRLRCIDHPHNLGYGRAVKTGLRLLHDERLDIAICLHADGQYAPEELPKLIKTLQQKNLDILQGSRIASGTAIQGGMPLYKYCANRILTTLENKTFRLALTDYHSGYMVYRRRALQRIPFERLSDSFDFDLEMIAAARAVGLNIGEAPIPTHYGDEISYLNPVTYGLRALRVIGKYRLGYYHRLYADARLEHEAS